MYLLGHKYHINIYRRLFMTLETKKFQSNKDIITNRPIIEIYIIKNKLNLNIKLIMYKIKLEPIVKVYIIHINIICLF